MADITDESKPVGVATWTANNVDVDDRGYIYAVDRANTGMHILKLTGPAREVADFSGAGAAGQP
jgi:hypothetical protein